MKQASVAQKHSHQDPGDKCVRILWTGGWDSTFRVLYATLVDGRRVEPHYIVDTERSSSLRELKAISEIRDLLRASDKEAYERVSNLEVTPINEIPEDADITNSVQRLQRRAHLGDQYDWLARYAHAKDLAHLELSVHIDDKVYFFLQGHVEQTPLGTYRLKHNIPGDEHIFARFEFPILEYSKIQMRNIARKHGFLEILEKSWFCHKPINGTPCGMCGPCVYTVEEGMRYRLPRESLFRYHARGYSQAIQAPFLHVRRSLSRVKAVRRAYEFLRSGSKR